MDKLLIIICAATLIGFILWWFFGKRNLSEAKAEIARDNNHQEVIVTVDGGYLPNIVTIERDIPAKIIFDRKDPSGCFSHVVFPDFGINEELPIGEKFAITINTTKAGEYQYSCGMNMFHGKVIIK